MFTLFANPAYITQVFAKYTVIEALRVKSNIKYALEHANIPSPELLTQMQEEGFDITEFGEATNPAQAPKMVTQGVLLANLKAVFLDKEKLTTLIKQFSLAEKAQVKDIILNGLSSLRLPSDSLIEKMAAEGVSVALPAVATKPAEQQDNKLASAKAKLAGALQKNSESNEAKAAQDKIAAARNKLNQSARLLGQPNNELAIARKKQLLSGLLKADDTPDVALTPELKVV